MSRARPPRSVPDIVHDLRVLGIASADTLMVHASLRAIGRVEGAADGILDALDEAVGLEGTVLMILGAEIAHDWVNQRPEAERPALLENAPPFDPHATPAFHEVGILAEVVRRRPGTIVTANPSGRFGARGAKAELLLSNAPWHDYYGPGSPLERLCEMGGRVLRIGASPDTTTGLHLAEYRAEVPNKRRVRRHYRCMIAAGPATCVVEYLDDEHGIVAWEGEDYFATILREFLATSCAKQGKVGTAQSELIAADDLVRFGARWMRETLV